MNRDPNKIYITDRVRTYTWRDVSELEAGTLVIASHKTEGEFFLLRIDDKDSPLVDLKDGIMWEEDAIPWEFKVCESPITIDPPKKK